jgi:hypothetical protein
MRHRIGDLSRRELLKLFGMSVGATMAGSAAWPSKIEAQSAKVTPRKTARNCIVIQNCGAMSPWETLDLKETKYTAQDLEIQKITSDFKLPKTLFPQGVQAWAPYASIVRTLRAVAVVHFPAQYHSQAGRAMAPALIREIPAFGSIIAKELESERRENDAFPTYMSFDLWNARCPQIGAGMLSPKFAGLDINTNSIFSSFGGGEESQENKAALSERWEALGRMMEVSPSVSAPLGPKADEYKSSYDYAIKLLLDPRFKKVLQLTEDDKKRYGVDKDPGNAKFGLGMLLARNVLASDAGARFLWVSNSYNGGNGIFDNHQNLYGRGSLAPRGSAMSIYDSAPRFDRALSGLVDDLRKMPGKEAGKTLFDETLIVVVHEFGRTPQMNPHGGRDHFPEQYSGMFMGGGIKPGRMIGKTDETGAKIVDMGWKFKEQPMMDHMMSTIYSALGIDYSKKIPNTPSGRAYEYQQTAPLGGPGFIPLTEIHELFV